MFSFSNHPTKRLFDEVENLVEIGENGHNTTETPYCHVEAKHFNFFEMKSGEGVKHGYSPLYQNPLHRSSSIPKNKTWKFLYMLNFVIPHPISFRPFINRRVKITRQNESKSATTGQNFRQYNSNVQKRRYSSRQENSDRKWRYQSSGRNDNGITDEGNQVGSNKSSRSVHFDDHVVWLRPNQTERIL